MFRLGAVVLVPSLLLVALEFSLRLFHVGYPTSFFLRREVAGRRVLTENDRFGWRFFGPALARTPRPIELSLSKPPGTCRIFIFGESAAYGDPKPEFGLPRMLEALLRGRYPGTKFEVMNVAMTGINSNVILPIAHDCAGLEGDIWVVYMGNNEVVGPFGSGTVFGQQTPDLSIIRGSIAVRATRVGELLTSSLSHLNEAAAAEPREWQGMAMFINNQVRQDDPRMSRVYSHFQRNLADILNVGRKHGAHVILSTVASNLKDCAPFGSLHRQNLLPPEKTSWEELFNKAVQWQQTNAPAEAVQQFQAAADLDDGYAELHFRWGQCLLALGKPEEARTQFVRARDLDTLRFRADSRLNEIVRTTAAGRSDPDIKLLDAEQELAKSAPQGLLGETLFYEHVHLTFEGNYRLALAVADQIVKLTPEKFSGAGDDSHGWPSQSDCARMLAWTVWDQYRAAASLISRLNEPPFTSQFDHEERYAAVREHLEQLLPEQRGAPLQHVRQQFKDAIALSPEDWVLQRNFANLLLKLGDLSGAEAAMRRSIELIPHDLNGHVELGLLLLQARRPEEAGSEFELVLREDPRSVPALNGLALARNALGNPERALAMLKQALAIRPGSADTHLNLGTALAAAGQKDQARDQFRVALQEHLGTPDLMVRLGKICMAQGWVDEGITNFQKAVSFDPVNPTIHWYLGGALDTRGRFEEALLHFSESVRLDPNFANGHLSRGIELSRLGKEPEAADAFASALKLDPGLLDARMRLGVSLARQRKLADARAQFEQVLQVQPNNTTAQRYLQSILNGPQASP
jgi:tetratricopeptide (TPR) repeat protein